MKHKLYILLVLLSFNLFANEKDFDQLIKLFRQQCRSSGLYLTKKIRFEYDSEKSTLINVDKYAEITLKYHLKNKQVTWLKSGLVYNTYTRWPKSGFWKSIGHGYQAIKINNSHGLFPKVSEILTHRISPKYEALYFLHGQYASSLIKVINKLKDTSIESCNQFIQEGFAEDWFESISLVYPQKVVGISNLDAWFKEEALDLSNSPMAEMPVEYVKEKFEELFKIKSTRILSAKKTVSEFITFEEAQNRYSKKVLKAVGQAYHAKALQLWMESPVVIRPQIELLFKAFTSMQKGKNDRVLKFMAEARQNFKLRCHWAVSISRWLDNAETGTVPADERFRAYIKVFQTSPKTKYSAYLDRIEQQLESLKE